MTPRLAPWGFLITLLFALAILVAAPVAEAQTPTIDVQFSGGTAFSGAAVIGSGGNIWNKLTTASGGPTSLNTVSGAASGATITWSANGLFAGGGGGFSSTAYANLMSQYLYLTGSASKTISFAGLAPSTAYTVYLYTQGDVASGGRQTKVAPALGVLAITSATSANGTYSQAFNYAITASGAPTTSAPTNASASTFISGQNYLVISTGTDSSGNLSLSLSAATGEADINGLQLVAGSAITQAQTYSVTQTLPTGLSLNTSTGVISGTPTQTGNFPVSLGAGNSFGITIRPLAITVAKAAATVTVNSATVTYDGTQKSLTIGTSPSGLAVSVTYSESATPPTTAGTYNVVATVTDPNYTGSGTGTLVINQAAPSLSWSQPAAVTYGTALSSTQLNATANTAGTFVYSPLSGAVLTAGSQTLNVTFTPTDTTDYTTATGSVTLTVNKAVPTITWGPPPVASGTVLSSTQLNATASTAGTFAYSPGAGTVLSAGSNPITVTFTPTDTADYTTATLTVNLPVATITLSNLTQTYTGSVLFPTVTTVPAGLSYIVNPGSNNYFINAGTYPITAAITSQVYAGSTSGTFTISPASQTISFAPTGTVTVGVPVTLSATASSGLPVTFTLVSGNASLSGNSLTALDGNAVVVQASQAGNTNYNAATSVTQSVLANLTAKTAQTITFPQPPSQQITSGPLTLKATASSGLPVVYTITSGPAFISGSTVTLTGAPGTVVVQANQAGNNVYAAAPAVSVSFGVAAIGTQTYFGSISTVKTSSSDEPGAHAAAISAATSIAGYVASDQSGGTLIGYLAAQNQGFVVSFTLGTAGTFTATTSALTGTSTAGPTLTFVGQVSATSITGTIQELGASFTATLDPLAGPSSSIAGLYQGAQVNSAAGGVYSVVGTQNDAFVLAITPSIVTAGSATVANNAFTVAASSGATITGSFNTTTTALSGSVTTAGGTIGYSDLPATTARTDRLVNLSARALVGTGQNVLVAGLIVSGPNSKPVLLRAVGPGLGSFGVPGVLSNPVLTLFDVNGNVLASNSGWGGSASLASVFSQVGAFPLATASADAALLSTLQPGAYTIQVSGANGATGIALAEVYDASVNPQSQYQRLINISSRGNVSTGAGVLFDGFIITGNSPKKVLIRGVGPTLRSLFNLTGTLSDPTLNVYDSNGNLVAQNDNWGTPVTVGISQSAASAATISAAASSIGAFPLAVGSNDSAVIVTLAPGAYTAQVSGVGASTGIAMVEVYEISP